MAFNFKQKDFVNLQKVKQEWQGFQKSEQDEFFGNINKLKELTEYINGLKIGYYADSRKKPFRRNGKGKPIIVAEPFFNIFPNWMLGLTVNNYEIGYIINQDENGFDLSIAFCDNHYKSKTPKSIKLYHWEVNTIINMNDDELVKDIIEQCDTNTNKLVEEGVKNSVSACVNYQKGTLPASFTRPIPLNQILYGPPGTGKTYSTVLKAIEILEPSNTLDWDAKKKRFDEYRDKKLGQIVFTTFHQSMSYEDFVEGIKPEPVGTRINYKVIPGIFKKLCNIAKDSDKKYVLIIDEINRGNVSQIFGELITLLEEDKRIGKKFELKVRLPYSNEDFGVPSNIYIIGTMNTADRSVEALDTALRRRFSFVEMMPIPDKVDEVVGGVRLRDVFEAINQRIAVLKDREHQIGHSYFMKCKTWEDIKAAFKNEIIPLLQEYFYGNYKSIRLVLGKEFVKETEEVKFAGGQPYGGDPDKTRYRLLMESEWKKMKAVELKSAINALLDTSNNFTPSD